MNEVVLAVPESQLISVKRIREEDPELMNLMLHDCPQLFSPAENDESEQLSITLYLMIEYSKGKRSELYEYLQILPQDIQFLCDWDKEVLDEL